MTTHSTHLYSRPMPARFTPTVFDWAALVLLTFGGVNWGLVGLFNIDLVAAFFGAASTAGRVAYGVVGFAAVYSLSFLARLSLRP